MWKRLETIFRPESKYRAFFLSVITVGLSYGLYKGVIDNYLAEIVGMSGFDKGVSGRNAFIRSARSSCWPVWLRRPSCRPSVCW